MNFADGDQIIRYSVEIPKMDFNDAGNMSPEEKADFEKFCKYMKMYEGSKGETPEEKPTDDNAPKGGKEDDSTPNKDNQMADETKKKDFAAEELTAKYSELNTKFEALVAQNREQATVIVELQEKSERDGWRTRYAEQRIPSGRLKVDEEIDFLMDLPKDKRQPYFDKSVRAFVAPSQNKLEGVSDAATAIEPGSAEEAGAVKKYYDDNKGKGLFKNYAEAQQRWIKENRK
jgi:hypothetical protein